MSSSRIDTVLLKVASRCNIACDYCYIYTLGDQGWSRNPKRMSRETIQVLADQLARVRQAQEVDFAVVLHGGEPLLLGHDRLTLLLETLRARLGHSCLLSMQTNGVLLDGKTLDLCERTRTTLAVSLDGPRKVHDQHRVGHGGEGTFDAVMNGIRLLQKHPAAESLFSGTLTVIDPGSSPREIYSFLKSVRVPSMDFLFRDGNHDRLPPGKADVASVEYGRWMAEMWDIYTADPAPVPISFLDDQTRLLLGGYSMKEGKGTETFGILVVDTDGEIAMNDTLKSSHDGADRFDRRPNVSTHDILDLLQSEEFEQYRNLQIPTHSNCRNCDRLEVCGGGMPLYRWSDDAGYNNPSVYCADHLHVIGHIEDRLRGMA